MRAPNVPVHCAHDAVVSVDSIKPNPRNPNRHPREQVSLLAKIIQAQGWRVPITVSNRSGLVVRGHCRLLAAKEAGLTEVPVDYQDYASEAEELADLIADNRLSELADVDGLAVKMLLEGLDGKIDLELTGFSAADVEDLISRYSVPDVEPEYDEDVAGEVKTVECPKCGHRFPV